MKGSLLLIACLLAMVLLVTLTEAMPAKQHEEDKKDSESDTKDHESDDDKDEQDSEDETDSDSSGSGSGDGKYVFLITDNYFILPHDFRKSCKICQLNNHVI